ncbi:hypothetical protein [Glaciecola sp. 1036]|uniref:hypothetical protein n=1 Tax=Alteromonadaceae TaxID=72275 RepID=UPI003D0158BE
MKVTTSGIFSQPFYLVFLLLIIQCNSSVSYAKVVKNKNNEVIKQIVEVYQQDFNDISSAGLLGLQTLEGPVTSERIYSDLDDNALLLTPESDSLIITWQAAGLLTNQHYQISFDYLLIQGNQDSSILSGFYWPGVDLQHPFLYTGAQNISYDESGTFSRSMLTGDSSEIEIHIVADEGTYLIDNIRIERIDHLATVPEPKLIKAGFPRIGNYNLYSVHATAIRNQADTDDVIEVLSLFDLVTGYEVDDTLTPFSQRVPLKTLNPNQIILPYFQTFVAQWGDNTPVEPIGEAAGLIYRFNKELDPDWYLRSTDGNLLEEPMFPHHFQLNPNSDFVDYAHDFLQSEVLINPNWSGIHFDQAEWYPNPLLADSNAFLDKPGNLPPMDVDQDGVEESLPELNDLWMDGFIRYFTGLREKIGDSTWLFGNAGSIASRPSILTKLNGMQREFTSPYRILENGDWETDISTGWYKLFKEYKNAETYLRAPQIINFQFTGYKLGTPDEDETDNSLESRLPVLEPRDFQRMRLGLTTVLMGDGFFGYDFTDNTTLPIWFDEYAVNQEGVAEASLESKGYLGQPLTAPTELPNEQEIILEVDFEQLPTLPEGVILNTPWITDDPNFAIDNKSAIVSNDNAQDETFEILTTDPDFFVFEQGATYQVFVDYRILNYESRVPRDAILSVEIANFDIDSSEQRAAAIWEADPGQRGTIRFSAKITSPDARLLLNAYQGIFSIDNIRIYKGDGGAYRRDFERGIVLVNPTPNTKVVSLSDIKGVFNRTNIKRINGTQDPVVNTGEAVNGAISLSPADGIILLADELAALPLTSPSNLSLEGSRLSWSPLPRWVAGYLIRYGIQGGELDQFTYASQSAFVDLPPLQAGTAYEFEVAAFDEAGNLSPFSDTFVVESEFFVQLPIIDDGILLSPNALATISGEHFSDAQEFDLVYPFSNTLADTEVLINGVNAPLLAVTPNIIYFTAPNDIGGDKAHVVINRNGVRSATKSVSVIPPIPQFKTLPNAMIHALDQNFVDISENNPAVPGQVILVLMEGLGGIQPQNNKVRLPIELSINDGDFLPVDVYYSHDMFAYYMTISLPEDSINGLNSLTTRMNNFERTGHILVER